MTTASAAALCTALIAGCGSDDTDSTSSSQATYSVPAAATSTAPEPVTVGQSFHLEGPTFGTSGQDGQAGMTFVIPTVDTTPMCKGYDSASGDYVPKEQPFIAIEFDVAMDADSAPRSFGSPNWFRAKDPQGYVTDDVSVSVPTCDDAYPEFTDNDLSAGEKHRGWVMFDDDEVKPGDQLIISWPNGTQSVVLTIPQ